MISTATALYGFFSGFDIPAYGTNTVPDDAELPYLTFPLTEPEWSSSASFYVTVYYRNEVSNYQSLSKADEIVQAIGPGVYLECEGGIIMLTPMTPLIQELPPDGDVRGAYINLQINAYHMPGI